MGSQIDGDKLAGYDKPGGIVGMGMELFVGKKVGIQPEISYCQKGARSTSKSLYYSIVRLTYLDIAGITNIYLKENLAVQAGFSYGVLLKASADGGLGFVDASSYFNKGDFCYLVGIDYRFTPRTSANLRFGYSLFNISSNTGTNTSPQYNNTLSFTLRFLLGDLEQ